jgi:predicted GTPase
MLIRKHGADIVVFAYSDISHENLMHKASLALAEGCDFLLLGPKSMYLKSRKPVIAVCAVRTGSGKSPTSRYIATYLRNKGLRVGIVRHPMPYGELVKQEVQRFSKYSDFAKYSATIEEMEEYEPYLDKGIVVYAGVDYKKILKQVEKESDVILFDGGNNDMPFYEPDLHITIADPHRPGHEMLYHPGEANLRAADVILVGKTGTAQRKNVKCVMKNARLCNPEAKIIKTDLRLIADQVDLRGKKVLVIEDGPTLTHGEMPYGGGTIYAKKAGADIIDASKYAVGSIKEVFKKYPHLKRALPAMGYSKKQIADLQSTINRSKCDYIIEATPINLRKLMKIKKHVIEVDYELAQSRELDGILDNFCRVHKLRARK